MKEIDTRYGTLRVPVDDNDLIGRFLMHYGEWAWDEVSFLASVVPDNARVLDIGACFGTFGIGLSQVRRLSKICFIDGNPAVIPSLDYNVKHNVKTNYAVKEAIIGRPGMEVARVHADPENIGSASFTPDENAQPSAATGSHLRSLKEIWDEEGPFDFIKVDAEGMELSIIDSYARGLSKGETTLWLECNEDEQSLVLCDRLLSWDLDVYYFAFPSHNPDNYQGQDLPIFSFAYEAGLLVAPHNEPVLSAELKEHGCTLSKITSVEALRARLWETPRWGYPEWQGKKTFELAALAGHALRDESFANFLKAGWKNKIPLTEVKLSLEAELGKLADEVQEKDSANRIELDKAIEKNLVQQKLLEKAEAEQASLLKNIVDIEQRFSVSEEIREKSEERILELTSQLQFFSKEEKNSKKKIELLEHQLSDMTSEMFDRIAEATDQFEKKFESERCVEYVYVPSNGSKLSEGSSAAHDELVAFLQDRIRSMEISTTWRITAPLRSMIEKFPLMHSSLRLARRAAATIRDKCVKAAG